jgi:hypothetical protein
MTNLPQPAPKNKTGYTGVYPSGKKYRAEITINKVTYRLGQFSTLEQAIQARAEAWTKAWKEQKL